MPRLPLPLPKLRRLLPLTRRRRLPTLRLLPLMRLHRLPTLRHRRLKRRSSKPIGYCSSPKGSSRPGQEREPLSGPSVFAYLVY